MAEESRGDLPYLLGHVAWRLVQAAAVTAGAILVLMLIPRSHDSKEKAYIAAMKSDLRNLVTAQEAYFADHVAYAAAMDQLRDASQFWSSAGVTLVIEQVTAEGWRAIATHGGTKVRCGIFVGNVPPPRKGMVTAQPLCWTP